MVLLLLLLVEAWLVLLVEGLLVEVVLGLLVEVVLVVDQIFLFVLYCDSHFLSEADDFHPAQDKMNSVKELFHTRNFAILNHQLFPLEEDLRRRTLRSCDIREKIPPLLPLHQR